MSDYQTKLDAWKAKKGIPGDSQVAADDLMWAQEIGTDSKGWCLACEKKLPIREMKLITRTIDPSVQISDLSGYYIPFDKRVRMCPECFAAKYPK